MSDVTLKELMNLRFDEQDKRVALALAALTKAHDRQRDNTSFWLSLMALGVSLASLYMATHK